MTEYAIYDMKDNGVLVFIGNAIEAAKYLNITKINVSCYATKKYLRERRYLVERIKC